MNFGYYCHLLPGFSVKFAHQNFTDACYIWGHCSRQINIKIRNSSHGFLVCDMRFFGSNFKTFKFSIYPIICLKKTHLHKNHIVQWVAKVLACSTNFWIFLVTFTHLNVSWCYKMITIFRRYFLGGKVGLASNLLEMNHNFCVLCWLEGYRAPIFGTYCTV